MKKDAFLEAATQYSCKALSTGQQRGGPVTLTREGMFLGRKPDFCKMNRAIGTKLQCPK